MASNSVLARQAAPIKRPAPTTEEFVRRAELLLPGLRERAATAERLRRLPDETIDEFRAAEFHMIMQPVEFGGYGLGMDVGAEVIRTLGMACGSSAWVAHLYIMHNWLLSLFPIEAQRDYWAQGPNALCATASLSPRNSLEEVEGGYRLSGRWKFASGSDFADWFVIMRASPERADWFLLPRSDVTIVDEWFVSGLCATGSRDVDLDAVFVPSHRVLSMIDMMAGRTFGRLPIPQQAVWGIPAALLGMVTGMAAAVEQGLVGKFAPMALQMQVERVANQMKLAEVHAEIHSAELIMRHRLAQLRDSDDYGSTAEGVEAYLSERDAAYVARLVAKTAGTLAIMGGASSIYLSNPIQRFQRDINAGVTHISLVWEEVAEGYGRAVWGLPRKGR